MLIKLDYFKSFCKVEIAKVYSKTRNLLIISIYQHQKSALINVNDISALCAYILYKYAYISASTLCALYICCICPVLPFCVYHVEIYISAPAWPLHLLLYPDMLIYFQPCWRSYSYPLSVWYPAHISKHIRPQPQVFRAQFRTYPKRWQKYPLFCPDFQPCRLHILTATLPQKFCRYIVIPV